MISLTTKRAYQVCDRLSFQHCPVFGPTMQYRKWGGCWLANRRKIAPESLRRFRARVRQLTRRHWSISLEERVRRLKAYLYGWRGYFGFCET